MLLHYRLLSTIISISRRTISLVTVEVTHTRIVSEVDYYLLIEAYNLYYDLEIGNIYIACSSIQCITQQIIAEGLFN